jgi:hypothetical protein
MDHVHERLEALEQQMHTVTRRLRWWRGLACGLAVASLLGWGLPLSLAWEDAAEKDKDRKGLVQRVAALEQLLKHFSREGKEIFITEANLHIVNGLGSTDCINEQGAEIPDCPNGLGNLIVGYNEPRVPADSEDLPVRTGSHNMVVGQEHNFSRFGGIVVGLRSTISGDFASVSGGIGSTASGFGAAVSGGNGNRASNDFTWVGGGSANTASGINSAVSGGANNTANGFESSISGGGENSTSGEHSSVSGGRNNTASGNFSSVSGGIGNRASGDLSSASDGENNTASGISSSVSGGQNITQETEFGWAAGSEADEVVVGNFRSP